MKLALFISIFFLSFFSLENDKEKMAWNEGRPLRWADFKGTPSGSSDYVASTNSGITFSYSYAESEQGVEVSYEIRSNFYPFLSWYRPEIVDAYILKHEQTHFDITELHARMLRQQLSSLRATTNVQQHVEAIYKNLELERQTMQNAFDTETEHSIKKEEELRWEMYIAAKLKEYDRWK